MTKQRSFHLWLALILVSVNAPTHASEQQAQLNPLLTSMLEEAQQRISSSPSASNEGMLGNILLGNQLGDRALVHFQRARELDPTEPQWAARIAQELWSLSDLKGAQREVDAALAVATRNPELHFLAGQIHETAGEYEAALDDYRTALKHATSMHFGAEFAVGRVLMHLQHYEESRDHLLRAIAAAPGSSRIQATLARLSRLRPDLDIPTPPANAEPDERPVELLPPWFRDYAVHATDPTSIRSNSRTLIAIGDHVGAKLLLNRLVEHYPDSADEASWIDLAFMQAASGQIDEAMQSYARCIAKYPDSAEAMLGLAEIRLARGELEFAKIGFRDALPLATAPRERSRALQGQGRVAAMSGNLEEALALLTEARDAMPEQALVYEDLARVFADLKRFDEAWDNLARAEQLGLQISPDFKRALAQVSGRPVP